MQNKQGVAWLSRRGIIYVCVWCESDRLIVSGHILLKRQDGINGNALTSVSCSTCVSRVFEAL
jgi:hypothetical protein